MEVSFPQREYTNLPTNKVIINKHCSLINNEYNII